MSLDAPDSPVGLVTGSAPVAVAVIIVNYGTADLAIEAVESVLARDHGGLGVEVHLVDNASPDNDAARLSTAAAGWGDRVTLYLEAVNHGFGRGNNLVLEALWQRPQPPAMVYLLNPDARLKTEVIAELAGFLDRRPDVGVVGSGIDRPEDGAALTCAFRFPTLISETVAAIGFGPLSRLFARWDVPLSPDQPTGPVDWVAGASVMARLGALAEVGFFDPDYFLYYEEVDLMHRLRRRGWATWHLAEARIAHVAGAATGVHGKDARRKPLPAYWYDSWRMYFEKIHGPWYARATALARFAGTGLGDLIARLRGRTPGSPDRFRRDFWHLVIAPLFGFRGRNA